MGTKATRKVSNGGRVKSNTTKAGITRDRQRKYGCGGKLKTK